MPRSSRSITCHTTAKAGQRRSACQPPSALRCTVRPLYRCQTLMDSTWRRPYSAWHKRHQVMWTKTRQHRTRHSTDQNGTEYSTGRRQLRYSTDQNGTEYSTRRRQLRHSKDQNGTEYSTGRRQDTARTKTRQNTEQDICTDQDKKRQPRLRHDKTQHGLRQDKTPKQTRQLYGPRQEKTAQTQT